MYTPIPHFGCSPDQMMPMTPFLQELKSMNQYFEENLKSLQRIQCADDHTHNSAKHLKGCKIRCTCGLWE